MQLNSTLFAKCLVRKDVASSSGSSEGRPPPDADDSKSDTTKVEDEEDFSSKAQIMTLMTTDVDRVSDFSWHIFSLVGMSIFPYSADLVKTHHMANSSDSPIEIAIGAIFLYKLLGTSCFVGLAFTCLFLPLNHHAGKFVVKVQEGLMKSRDERVALMNEVLGAIRMIKVRRCSNLMA